MNQTLYQTRTVTDAVTVNRVLRNTYILLSMTLLFSAAMAVLSLKMNAPYPGVIIVLVGYFGLLFLTSALKNSAWGILSILR